MERWLAADARRPFRLHHADLLQRRLQGDAGGAAPDRLQRGVCPSRPARTTSSNGWASCGRPGSPPRRHSCRPWSRSSSASSGGSVAHPLRFVAVDGLLSSRSHPARVEAPARQAGRRVLRPLRSRHDDRPGAARWKGRARSAASPKVSLRSATTMAARVRPGQVGQVDAARPECHAGLPAGRHRRPADRPRRRLAGDRRSRPGRRTWASHHRRPHQGDHQSRRREDRTLRRREGAAGSSRGARGGGIRRALMRGSARMWAPPSCCIPALAPRRPS